MSQYYSHYSHTRESLEPFPFVGAIANQPSSIKNMEIYSNELREYIENPRAVRGYLNIDQKGVLEKHYRQSLVVCSEDIVLTDRNNVTSKSFSINSSLYELNAAKDIFNTIKTGLLRHRKDCISQYEKSAQIDALEEKYMPLYRERSKEQIHLEDEHKDLKHFIIEVSLVSNYSDHTKQGACTIASMHSPVSIRSFLSEKRDWTRGRKVLSKLFLTCKENMSFIKGIFNTRVLELKNTSMIEPIQFPFMRVSCRRVPVYGENFILSHGKVVVPQILFPYSSFSR